MTDTAQCRRRGRKGNQRQKLGGESPRQSSPKSGLLLHGDVASKLEKNQSIPKKWYETTETAHTRLPEPMTVRHVLRDIKKSLDKLERKRKETPEQPWAKIRADADERKTTLIGAAGMNATLLQMQERQMRIAAFASNKRVIEVAMRALHPRKKRREEAR